MPTAHLDTFARDRLPPREQWPDLIFTRPEFQYPEQLNCATQLLDRHIAQGNGARRCILSSSGEAWTYADLQRKANQIAHVLVEDLGIVPGNRVLLRAPNCAMMAACWYAVMKAGAIAVSTMPLYKETELRYMIEKAEIHLALCDERLLVDLNAATAGRTDITTIAFGNETPGGLDARMAAKPGIFENVATAAEDVALIAFTSGTTGKAKATVHFHRDVMAACDAFPISVLKAESNDLYCGSPPLAFTFGLGLLIFPMHVGAAALLLEKATPELLLQGIQDHKATIVFTAPIAYRAMTAMLDRFDISSLRKCVSAGETLPLPIWQAWHDATGLKIIDGIGGTEMMHIYISSPEDSMRPGSTGQVVAGYEARIVDDDAKELPPNTIGRLCVRGPTGCRYLDDPRQTQYVQDGWNYPGDAYRMDADGYFWYVARTDDMIVAAGYNISGPEVEQALLAHPDVKECAVVAAPDVERHTQMVKAFVVLNPDREANEGEVVRLQEFVKTKIATFKCPRAIEFVEVLPRTETGKVQRFKLRNQEKERAAK